MTRLSAYTAAALGIAPQESAPLLPEARGPASQVSKVFSYQSYFDDTLSEKALLQQDPNNPIVPSTLATQQVTGYGVGLHPSSQTPVAIQFLVGGGQPSNGQAIFLKPGQVVRPFGLPDGRSAGAFSGFQWGLPFGWLGGGLASLVVLSSPDSDVNWHQESPEIIFHRIRLKIYADNAIPGTPPYNWPMRFPWTRAVRDTNSAAQSGSPILAITPTRTIMQLRLATLAAAASMRMVTAGTEFDSIAGYDVTWGTWASLGAGSQYQMISVDDLGWRLSGDDATMTLVSSAASLQNQYVDIVRYGKLA